jgi:multiple sugar transport system permease protein
MKTTRLLFAALGLFCLAFALPGAGETPGPVEVNVHGRFYYPSNPERPTTMRSVQLMREDPGIRITQWSGLSLPAGGSGRTGPGRASLMMAIAGKTAPDIIESWVHIIRTDIDQGFLYPLNEWIGEDADGNGLIDEDEATWERWKEIPPLNRQIATVDGKVYGIPQAYTHYFAVIYRVDMVRSAGLDPGNPPQTWDQFVYWCQKLTDPKKDVPGSVIKMGQRGLSLLPYGWQWLPWLQSTGGDPVVQIRRNPSTGQDHTFAAEATTFVTESGEDLTAVKPTWRANFASEEGIRAAEFYYKLRWMKWITDPVSGEPISLSGEDLNRGTVAFDGRTVKFANEDVVSGVARSGSQQRSYDMWKLLGRGEVAMLTWGIGDLGDIGREAGLDPDLLGWFPFPAGPEGTPVIQRQSHYATMVEAVGDRPKHERDKVWRVMTAVTDRSVRDAELKKKVLSGLARFVPPQELKRLGFDDYLKDVSKAVRRNFQELEQGIIKPVSEPFMGFWMTVSVALDNQVFGRVLSETGESFDYVSALKKVERDANTGVMFARSEEELQRYRPAARVLFLILAAVMAGFVVLIVRSMVAERAGTTGDVYRGWLPWALILPAVLLIGLWGYYPLLKGLVMAFQDYRIAGDRLFVGLDNFITLALDGSFWASMGRTVYFVLLNMLLAFLAPIFLAILLSEVPSGKILFRTLFFLPQVTSALVVALLWRMLYDPTPYGFLNQIIGVLDRIPFLDISPQTWLQDPRLAMICCVIPTVWASMGMASLIYLAALKSVPEEIYEAADVDGAGMFSKLRRITLPTLFPLIVINFVGTFVATFQNMGNIFLLTFGGPGESTMVVGMRIWIEAYNNLRFSLATSMAWVLGAVLIAFTYVQIRFLRRVEFKKADWD